MWLELLANETKSEKYKSNSDAEYR